MNTEEYLPEWAIKKSDGTLEEGLQLCTKDGRRVGNAVIIKKYTTTFHTGTPMETSFVTYEILTDTGNLAVVNEEEIVGYFYLGNYVMDVKEACKKRGHELV